MSRIILPDDILAAQVCDVCYKYLSVQPVVLANSNKILCGRCVENPVTNNTESMYNVLAESLLFKCINRFEGCTELLSCNEVIEHETLCKAKTYICPLCQQDPVIIPSYMFPYHIKKTHPKFNLTTNCFNVDVNDLNNMFFYQKENYLFFIHQQMDEGQYLKLNTFHIGGSHKKSEVIFQKYEIKQCDKQLFETPKRVCEHFNDLFNGQATDIVNMFVNGQNLESITVKFDFELPNLVQYVNFQTKKSAVVSHTSIDNFTESNQTDNSLGIWIIEFALSHSIKSCKSSVCSYGKEIFRNHMSVDHGFKLIEGRTKIEMESKSFRSSKVIFCLHCIMCKLLRSFDEMFITREGKQRYLICNLCMQLVSDLLDFVNIGYVMSKDQYILKFPQKIYYMYTTCQFDQSMFFNNIKCPNFLQNRKYCFIESCSFVLQNDKDTINELENHFRNAHKQLLYVSTKSMFETQFFVENTYVSYWDVLIHVKLEVNNNEHWISTKICKDDQSPNSRLLCGLYSHDGKIITPVFDSKVKVDLGEIGFITFTVFEHNVNLF